MISALAASAKASPVVFFNYGKAAGTMKTMVREAAHNPALIAQAIDLVRQVPQGDYVAEAQKLFEAVRGIRYTGDISGEDVYRDPMLTWELQAGDCNNKVVLGCALAKAVGFPTRLVFVFDKAQPDMMADFPFHVYYQVDIGKGEREHRWIACETIPVPESGFTGGPKKLLSFGDFVSLGYPEYVEVDS